MKRVERIEKLKKYKQILIYATGYESKEEKENNKLKQDQKVLVLRKKY